MNLSDEWQASEIATQSVVRETDWVKGNLLPISEYRVGSLVPCAFASYARIFHPAHLPFNLEGTGERPVSWSTTAAEAGGIFHEAADWERMVGPRHGGDSGLESPELGELSPAERLAIYECLSDRPVGDNTIHFAFSASNNVLRNFDSRSRPVQIGPDFFHIFLGTQVDILKSVSGILSSLWWPATREWFVASNLDQNSSFLGASASAVQRVVHDFRIEALPVSSSQSILGSADNINRHF